MIKKTFFSILSKTLLSIGIISCGVPPSSDLLKDTEGEIRLLSHHEEILPEGVQRIQYIDEVNLSEYTKAVFVVPANIVQGAPRYFLINSKQYLIGSDTTKGIKNYLNAMPVGEYEVYVIYEEAKESGIPGLHPRSTVDVINIVQFVELKESEEPK